MEARLGDFHGRLWPAQFMTQSLLLGALLGDGKDGFVIGAVFFDRLDDEVLRLIWRHAGNAFQAEFHHLGARGDLFIEFGHHVDP